MYPKHNQNKNHSQPMKILKKNLLKNISGGEKFTFTYTCNWPRIAKISTSQTWGSSKCQILYLLKIVSKLKKFILATNIFWCSGSLIALKNKRVLYYSLLSKLNLEHIHLKSILSQQCTYLHKYRLNCTNVFQDLLLKVLL